VSKIKIIKDKKMNNNSSENSEQKKGKKLTIFVLVILAIFLGASINWFFKKDQNARKGNLIEVDNTEKNDIENRLVQGEVSPISGVGCENWNRRPIAVMQPADVPARPAAGFSEADMVIEMPVITAGFTRLMGIYVCNLPVELGSMRSARHDFIHLAKGLDAIFVSWGRSESHVDSDTVGLAKGILDRREIENINCNGDAGVSAYSCPENPCFRKRGMARGVDSGYSSGPKILACAKELGYRTTSNFSGYLHQEEAPLEERPEGGLLKIGFAKPFDVDYEYDKETNSYLRFWNDKEDTDRNNGKRLSPKNVVVMIASSEQIEGQYNNVQLGDPWYDQLDSGDTFYYMNGKEYRGKWKKDKSRIDSKLLFLDEKGEEVKFVPGQIWVEILEPGQKLKWKTAEELENE